MQWSDGVHCRQAPRIKYLLRREIKQMEPLWDSDMQRGTVSSAPPQVPCFATSTDAAFVEHRAKARFPICFQAEYKVSDLNGKAIVLDMSSGGAALETDGTLPPNTSIRVTMDWPVVLDGHIPLSLIVYGKVLRSDRHCTAISIAKHEFKLRPRACHIAAQGGG